MKLRSRPQVWDAVIAAAVSAFAIATLLFDLGEGDTAATGLSYVIVAVAGIALLVRRRHPFVVLGITAVARIVLTWDTGNDLALAPAAMVALYTVARTGDRRRSLAMACGVALVMMVAVAALDSEAFLPELVGEGALLLLPIAVGDAARSRADRVRDLINTEADRRVSAERLRIARDLHDVVAHSLSTIAIQSGVAAHLLDRDPNQAREALEIINKTGKSSLEELRAMVGVLRSTDDMPLRPTPTDPNDLADLVDGAANAGIPLTLSIEGGFPAHPSDASVVAVHRIIKEALTNVARHAGAAPTVLSVRHGDRDVRLSIVNQVGQRSLPAMPSTGVGIIGMTERAESLGGTLTAAERSKGGFEVAATIPYHPGASGHDTQ